MARLGIHVEIASKMRRLFELKDVDPVSLAIAAEIGGADSIVCSLNEDMDVTSRDIKILKEVVKTHLNIQTPPMDMPIKSSLEVRPDIITLIPGKKPGSSQGGGVDILGQGSKYAKIIEDIRNQDIMSAVVIDPNVHQIKAAIKLGVDYVELHLGTFVDAEDPNEKADQFENLSSMVLAATKLGLGVSVGCGVTYTNASIIASLEGLEEMNVNDAVIARALLIGMESAVRDMAALVH